MILLLHTYEIWCFHVDVMKKIRLIPCASWFSEKSEKKKREASQVQASLTLVCAPTQIASLHHPSSIVSRLRTIVDTINHEHCDGSNATINLIRPSRRHILTSLALRHQPLPLHQQLLNDYVHYHDYCDIFCHSVTAEPTAPVQDKITA
eukprot:scaffold14632_cov22-Cyclotella_meneghiniana.AAC.1